MLSRSYFIYLTKKFGWINKIFGRVKKTIQAKTLVHSRKRAWLTQQKFGRLNQNVLCNQPYNVNQTIFLGEPFFLPECGLFSCIRGACGFRVASNMCWSVRGKMASGKMVLEKWSPEMWSPENWSPEKWSPEK